jgi:hypothetical protein
MTAPQLNAIGLVLNIVGVVLLFFFGFPQPTHEEGVGIGVEDATLLPNGKTVAEHNQSVKSRKRIYLIWSKVALGLVLGGFCFQLAAVCK